MSSMYIETRRERAVGASGGATESLGGVAVVILAILALVGVVPGILTPIAGIVFGAAFVVEGAAIAANLLDEGAAAEAGSGVTVELAAGLSAVVLGILALIGVASPTLMGALVITGGAGLILSAGVVSRIQRLEAGAAQAIAGSSAAAAHLLAGLAAVVLGILALTNSGSSAVLSTVGLLVLGGSLTLSGTSITTMVLRLFRRA